MIIQTQFKVDPNLFGLALQSLPDSEMKTTINQSTGDFFYDEWEIKEEYKGTIWETLYNSLPYPKGEARIIILDPSQSYQCHADIDDRYHLNIFGDQCFLIDLDNKEMFTLAQDGVWYDMNAGRLHTASNFGKSPRVQLVIRKLLNRNNIEDSLTVTIKPVSANLPQARYLFDYYVSPWLNGANKNGYITDFKFLNYQVEIKIMQSQLDNLKKCLPEGFVVE